MDQRNVWEITVSLGKDDKGIRHWRSWTVYGTKAEAQQHLRQFVDEVERSRLRRGTVAVGDWLSVWQPVGCGAALQDQDPGTLRGQHRTGPDAAPRRDSVGGSLAPSR